MLMPALSCCNREVYDKLTPGFRGRCTAPLLIDKRSQRAVSNESADIIRMLDELQLPGCSGVQLAPEALSGELDALNAVVRAVQARQKGCKF